jgi:cytoskeletal protein CcmA (bactofilin family)
MKRYLIDRLKKVLIVKKDSIVDRHIKFDGKIVAGMYSSFWGNVEAEEVYLSKGCYVGGIVKCKRAVIGPYSRFSSVMAEEDVLILDKCLGNLIKAGGNVRIRKGSAIKAVEASYVIVDGTSKIGKLSAKKVIVSSD